ncbi:MAG: MerR family transcriptional regulator [Alicyclobacillus sp.]|nr:MerR family transcriptional regulator [Alicyclobacillus sp.]
MPVFPIGVVQKLTGLTARQIRYYEQQGLLRPARTEGNQRLFSFYDVERLLEIRELLDSGLNIAGVRAHFAKTASRTNKLPAQEPSDKEVFRWLESDLLEGKRPGESEFHGDLSRFFKRKP